MKTSKLTTILALFFIIFASVEVVKEKENTGHNASAIVQDIEGKLKIENWMVSDSYWRSIKNSGLTRDYDILLELEPWITNVAAREFVAIGPIEKEKPLVLEAWMTKEKYWDKAENKFADIRE